MEAHDRSKQTINERIYAFTTPTLTTSQVVNPFQKQLAALFVSLALTKSKINPRKLRFDCVQSSHGFANIVEIFDGSGQALCVLVYELVQFFHLCSVLGVHALAQADLQGKCLQMTYWN